MDPGQPHRSHGRLLAVTPARYGRHGGHLTTNSGLFVVTASLSVCTVPSRPVQHRSVSSNPVLFRSVEFRQVPFSSISPAPLNSVPFCPVPFSPVQSCPLLSSPVLSRSVQSCPVPSSQIRPSSLSCLGTPQSSPVQPQSSFVESHSRPVPITSYSPSPAVSSSPVLRSPPVPGGRPLGEVWLRVGAIIAEFNMDGYGVAR